MVSTNDEMVSEVPAAEVQAMATEVKAISEEDFEKAQKTFQLGKKNLFLNKFDESVTNIGEACKTYSSKFGEFDPQCAEIYFFYGRALLELARVENTVLGNALSGVPEDTSPIDDSRYGNPEDIAADEKKEISDKVIDALCDREEGAEKPTEDTNGKAVTEETNGKTVTEDTNGKAMTTEETTNGKTEAMVETNGKSKEETNGKMEPMEMATNGTTETVAPMEQDEKTVEKKPDETKTEEGTVAAAAAEDEEEDEDEETADEDLTKNDDQAKDEAEADDISNLQRSWEMFELAKLVYSKNFDTDMVFKNKRVAECLLKLGEISIEQEIYEQAITDITESIRLQEDQKEERDERMLAESFYQLGLAQQFNNLFSEANESYQKSINIMQLRVEKLKAKMEASSADSTGDAELERNSIKEEIGELEALLPEMMAKLEEVNEQGQQSLTLIKEAKECFLNSIADVKAPAAGTNGVTVTNGEVKDITSLVKSKRKISATDDTSTNTKKTRLSTEEVSAETNGEAEATTTTTTNNVEMVEMVETAEKTEEAKPAESEAEKPAVETAAMPDVATTETVEMAEKSEEVKPEAMVKIAVDEAPKEEEAPKETKTEAVIEAEKPVAEPVESIPAMAEAPAAVEVVAEPATTVMTETAAEPVVAEAVTDPAPVATAE